jgi:hypothetical protein
MLLFLSISKRITCQGYFLFVTIWVWEGWFLPTIQWPEYRADYSSLGSAMIKENTLGFTVVTYFYPVCFIRKLNFVYYQLLHAVELFEV